MKKMLYMALILIMCVAVLCACETPTDTKYSSGDETTYGDRFVLLYQHNHNGFKVYVDVETRVQYMCDQNLNGVEWIVLVDKDGKPLLYEGELK